MNVSRGPSTPRSGNRLGLIGNPASSRFRTGVSARRYPPKKSATAETRAGFPALRPACLSSGLSRFAPLRMLARSLRALFLQVSHHLRDLLLTQVEVRQDRKS